MLHVVATIQLHPGKREAFLEEFNGIVADVRAEQGCLEYGPTIDQPTDIPTQGPVREEVVTVMEKWASLEALKQHLAAPHMLAYRERVKDLVAGVTLQVLRPA